MLKQTINPFNNGSIIIGNLFFEMLEFVNSVKIPQRKNSSTKPTYLFIVEA